MRRPLLVLALLTTGLALPALAVADVSGPAIVGFVNAQRAAQGLPAGIVEEPTLSAACAQHNRYSTANRVLGHDETPGRPGYSVSGRDAARLAVLYGGGTPWTATDNPFEEAPIHLHQLLAPRLDRMGAAETGAYGCATTRASRNRPAPPEDVSYTYPDDGATGWPAAQTASEAPYAPGEKVGIPAGTRTGPYLYVLFDGPGLSLLAQAQLTRATLTGPDGPRALATVDNTTPGVGSLIPTGAQLIPRVPLRPNTTYTASVVATVRDSGDAPRRLSRTWSFTTGAPAAARPARRFALMASRAGRGGQKLPVRRFALMAKLAGRASRKLRVRVTCSRACGVIASGTVRARGRTIRVSRVRTTLPRRGSRTLRMQISARDARRLNGYGRPILRLRIRGVDAGRHRITVRLRA